MRVLHSTLHQRTRNQLPGNYMFYYIQLLPGAVS